MTDHEIPQTEQGIRDYIRFADNEIKRSEAKIKKLYEMKSICIEKLTLIKKETE